MIEFNAYERTAMNLRRVTTFAVAVPNHGDASRAAAREQFIAQAYEEGDGYEPSFSVHEGRLILTGTVYKIIIE